MPSTHFVHVRPGDRFDPHVNEQDTMVVAVEGADGTDASLFFRDPETYRRFARAVVAGLALVNGHITAVDIEQAVEVCGGCGGDGPFLLTVDEVRTCARCAAVEVAR